MSSATSQTKPGKAKPKARAKPAKPAVSAKSKRVAAAPAVTSLPGADRIANEKLFKRRDLLEAIAARSAMPKSDLRLVMELVLDEMGKALDTDHDLAVAPLGRMRVARRRDTEKGAVLTIKMRRKGPDADPG